MTKTTLHYVHPTGMALAATSGLLYTLCALVIARWPVPTLQFFNTWMHAIDLSRIYTPPQLTLGLYFQGLLGIMLTAYFVGAIYALLYNLCVAHCQKKKWI